MEDEVKELIAKSVLGKQVDDFLGTDIGKYLLSRADADMAKGYVALRNCKPEDADSVRAAQNQIQVAENVVEWLKESVQAGLEALNIIEGRE